MENEEQHKDIATKIAGDKYRSILSEEAENKDIHWRHGGPPIFDAVNKLFEEGRTKVVYSLSLLNIYIVTVGVLNACISHD